MQKNRDTAVRSLFLIFALTLLAGCAGDSGANTTAPLDAKNVLLAWSQDIRPFLNALLASYGGNTPPAIADYRAAGRWSAERGLRHHLDRNTD